MELKTLRQKVKGLTGGEDRGVSPVIGVILMVAITVILAAVIGAFVLGLGEDLGGSQSPTLSTDMSANSSYSGGTGAAVEDVFYIAHSTGDEIAEDELRVVIRNTDGATVASFDSESGWNNSNLELYLDGTSAPSAGDVFEAGSTITIVDDDGGTAAGLSGEYTLQVVHRSSGSTVSEGSVEV